MDQGLDMPADVGSAFDVAFWFADMALHDNEYMQPQKLQRLLFIAQGYYTVAFAGRKLMPAVFVGPTRSAFSKGRSTPAKWRRLPGSGSAIQRLRPAAPRST